MGFGKCHLEVASLVNIYKMSPWAQLSIRKEEDTKKRISHDGEFPLDDGILIRNPHRACVKVGKVVVEAVFWRKLRLGVVKGLL